MFKALKRFRRDHRAISGLIIALVVALVTIAVLIPIGVLTAVKVHDALPAMTGTANTTTEAVYTNVYAAFNLASISPIVAAAGLIIAIVVGAFAYSRYRG